MVNIESQLNSYFYENKPSNSLQKMDSSVNLYDLLTNQSFISNDDTDNDLSSEINLVTIRSSISNDSAIVLDDMNDRQIKYRNSWPKMMKKNHMIYNSFSHSFEYLNHIEQRQHTIYDNDLSISKYKRPLPWTNPSMSSNKVLHFYFTKKNIDY